MKMNHRRNGSWALPILIGCYFWNSSFCLANDRKWARIKRNEIEHKLRNLIKLNEYKYLSSYRQVRLLRMSANPVRNCLAEHQRAPTSKQYPSRTKLIIGKSISLNFSLQSNWIDVGANAKLNNISNRSFTHSPVCFEIIRCLITLVSSTSRFLCQFSTIEYKIHCTV